MKPAEQVEAVKAELVNRNPGFDGTGWKYELDADKTVVRELYFSSANVTDLTPVRASKHLLRLECRGPPGRSKLADLSPLQGMKLWSRGGRPGRITDPGHGPSY